MVLPEILGIALILFGLFFMFSAAEYRAKTTSTDFWDRAITILGILVGFYMIIVGTGFIWEAAG